jgi:acetylglutamate/LysW-gamma-L-alpha-aminoadipate kinase
MNEPTLVIKAGGGTAIDVDAVVEDLVALREAGHDLVLVHGGAETTNAVAEALGHPPVFLTSESGIESRRTDRRTLEIFEMVYCGQLNKMWVEKLQRRDVAAVGLSGLDGRVFEGRRKDTLRVRQGGRRMVVRDDWTGTVERINDTLVRLLLEHGYLPVLTPPGASFAGEAINVDGDVAAAAVAVALGASTLVILSDVPGLLERPPDEETLIAEIPATRIDSFMGVAAGRMKKKLMGAAAALDGGVGRVILADGRVASPVRRALDGAGTHIAATATRTGGSVAAS